MASGCGCSSDLHTAVCEDSGGITLPIDASDVLYSSPGPYFPPTVTNVEEALDYINLNPAIVPSMTPLVEGTALGYTTLINEVTSIGGNSLATYAAGVPSGAVDTTTVCGAYNLVDLDDTVTTAQQNAVIGSSNILTAGPLTTFNGNVLVGHANDNFTLTDCTDNVLVGMGTSTYSDLFVARTEARNCTIVSTAGNTFAAGNLNQGLLLAGNTGALNVPENSVLLGAGSTAQFNSEHGVVITQGLVPYDNQSFDGVCALIGSQAAQPNLDQQLLSSHTTLRMPNMILETPTGTPQQLMMYDSTTGRISRVNPLGNFRRVFSTVVTTAASGLLSLNLVPLGLSLVPNVVATVRQASGSVYHGCKTISVTTTLWSGQVFESTTVVLAAPTMVPAVAGLLVDVVVCY